MVYAPPADSDRKRRLSPPLMYVFRSTEKQNVWNRRAATEADGAMETVTAKSQRGAITERTLQNEVAQDMDALLSHVAFDSSVDLADLVNVRTSILNFGFPDIAHRSIDELERADLDSEIMNILRRYEPRLIPKTLRVARDPSIDKSRLQIRYFVRADLSCHPLDIPVEFVADVDVTTGKLKIAGGSKP